MKNLENNGRLKKVIALLLVTTMVVGILSSAAVKLVASTYYMQTKRKLKTNIPIVDQFIDNVVDDGNIAGPQTTAPAVTAPATTEAPTTEAPSTEAPTTEAESTEPSSDTTTTTAPAGDSGSSGGGIGDILGMVTGLLGDIDLGGVMDMVGGLLGGLGGGSGEETTETTESTTESKESIKQKKEVLSKYNAVVGYAKTVGKPAFTKVTYRTLDKNYDAVLMCGLQSANPEYFISKENAEASPIVVPANSDTSEFLINNEKYASMLATENAAEAIESATIVKLEDGTQKITITLREEADPAVTAPDAKDAASFTSAMFPVVTGEEFGNMVSKGLKLTSLSSSSVTYKDCTVELIFNPITSRIVSIKQTTSYVGSAEAQLLIAPITSKGTVTEISEYRDFDYGII
ncbi:MAG: hypothetical protein UGF89_11220 [Acutalibacteraceae bacterium]|nr:hypothetical protein [Acutalibacteraceae bacterium]